MASTDRKITRLKNACRIEVAGNGQWFTPGRKPEACETPVPASRPVYQVPVAIEETLPDPQLPESLLLQNTDYTLTCADIAGAGEYGDPVTVSAGEVTAQLFWGDVPDISPAQLDYLASLEGPALQPLLEDGATAEQVETATRLNVVQSAFVAGQLAALKLDIQTRTHLSALSQIVCLFRNIQQSAVCEDSGAARTGQSEGATRAGVNNPSVVLYGAFSSTSSQSEANALAQLEARRRLTCLFGNDRVTLACHTDLGFPTPVPTDDPGSVDSSGRRRVGDSTVEADAFFASTKGAAMALARAEGLAQLDCYYRNGYLSVGCADKDPLLDGSYPAPVDYNSREAGNPVTVQEGTFIMSGPGASQDGVDQMARAAAIAQLDCRFRNARQEVTCLPVVVGGVTLVPQDGETRIVVEAGEVEAATQNEADALAREMGRMQLGCRYCNAFIPPSCYPPSYTPAAGQAIPAADITPDWSPDVVLGLAAGTLCLDDPTMVMTVSQTVAVQRPEVTDASCLYLNDEMWFGCLLALPGPPVLPRGGYHHPAYEGNANLPSGYEALPFDQQLSPYSSPSPALGNKSYLVIPAGSYSILQRDVPDGISPKQYANDQARLYGLSLLRCAFANPEVAFNCATANNNRFDQDKVAQDAGQVVQVTIPRAAHESYFSFREALLAAQVEAASLLDCYYENPLVLMRCWKDYGGVEGPPLQGTTGGIYVYGTGQATRTWELSNGVHSEVVVLKDFQPGSSNNPVRVYRGTFRSLLSPEDALRQAIDYAVAALDCTAQAQDDNVCNDALLIYCGGMIEPNPTLLNVGEKQVLDEKWTAEEDGTLKAGDGHNYVMVAGEPNPVMQDLGCSTDPVGGCSGTGYRVPPCLVRAATRHEANMLAYQLMRSVLTCGGSAVMPGTGGGGSSGEPGSDAPQTGCEGSCLAVYG